MSRERCAFFCAILSRSGPPRPYGHRRVGARAYCTSSHGGVPSPMGGILFGRVAKTPSRPAPPVRIRQAAGPYSKFPRTAPEALPALGRVSDLLSEPGLLPPATPPSSSVRRRTRGDCMLDSNVVDIAGRSFQLRDMLTEPALLLSMGGYGVAPSLRRNNPSI